MKILSIILRRIIALIPMILGISMLVFLLMALAPGDFLSEAKASRDVSRELLERMNHDFGLDKPWYIQYFLWLKNILSLNFGESWIYKISVYDLLMQRVPATVILAVTSLIFAWVLAVPLGVLAAIYKDSVFDRISAFLAYFALSIPEFFLALLANILAAKTGLFPIGGRTSIDFEFLSPSGQFFDYCHHLILPTIVLGIGSVAGLMRIMRANFLDEIRTDYVTTARAKGLPEGRIMFLHVLRNAINPFISSIGFAIAGLLSGALLVENVMNYPGLGQLVYQSLLKQDQYVVMAGVMIGSIMLMLGNLLADFLLTWSDPRIKLEEGGSQ